MLRFHWYRRLSADIVPPTTPYGTRLSRLAGNNSRLEWSEVTEGIREGNTYPEPIAITYQVFTFAGLDYMPGLLNFFAEIAKLECHLARYL